MSLEEMNSLPATPGSVLDARTIDARPPVQGRSSIFSGCFGMISLLRYLGPVGVIGSEMFGEDVGPVGGLGSQFFGGIFAKYFGDSG